jgi:hypothetical protein
MPPPGTRSVETLKLTGRYYAAMRWRDGDERLSAEAQEVWSDLAVESLNPWDGVAVFETPHRGTRYVIYRNGKRRRLGPLEIVALQSLASEGKA